MGDSFNKFKKKAILETIFRCLLISLSIGLLAFSIPFLIIKLLRIEFKTIYLILIGAGSFVLLFNLLFLILKPNDKKIAIKLDRKLDLKEKVQTMVEYINDESYVAKLQRENTNKILSSISVKRLSMKLGTMIFVLIGLAISFCITAVAIPKPQETEDPPIEDPDYVLDDWTTISIKDLIKYVKESSINDKLKAKHVSDLEGLLDDLADSEKESQMKEVVQGVIDNMNLQLDIINTSNEIYEVLKTSTLLHVISFSTKIRDLDLEAVGNSIDGFITLINGCDEAINDVDSGFGYLLKTSTLSKEDEAYQALVQLNDRLYDCRNESDVYGAVTNVVYSQKPIILASLEKQVENEKVTKYVINELNEIFGINDNGNTGNEDPNKPNTGNEDPKPDEPELPPIEQDYTGGYGTGEIIFGSDDSMFDPESGKIIFSDVISQYQNDINDRLEEGKIPEDLKEYFEYYYDILFGTIDNQE